MIAAWILFPLVLLVLAVGCGLLLEAAAGERLPGTLLVPAGLAVVRVTARFPTALDSTAKLATPLVVVLAVAGCVLGRSRRPRLDGWAAAAGIGAFAVYAAPIVL